MGNFQSYVANIAGPVTNTVLWLVTSIVLVTIALRIYTAVTPYNDIQLIRDGNKAVAQSLGGTLLGLCIPLAAVIIHTGKLSDLVLWAGIALFMQLLLLVAEAFVFPGMRKRMAEGGEAAGIWLGAMSLGGGIVVAACNIP